MDQHMILLILVFAAWVFVGIAGYYYVQYRKQQVEINEYLSDEQITQLDAQTNHNKWDWLVGWFDHFAPVGEKIQLFSNPIELEDYLIKANYPYGLTLKQLQGAKIVGAMAGAIIGFFYFLLGLPLAPMLLVFGPILGYMAPIFHIRSLAKKRQEEIQYELPDFLDMMSITLQAGMGMDTALEYYVQTTKGPLSEEIKRMLQEIHFGVQREAAYRGLLQRTESPELEALIQSLIQAHRLGTPISQTFAQQSEEMRRMRAEKAKEAAGKAEPKISIIGGLIIAPSIMLIILGSFALKFFYNEGGGF
ncbi:type II secretion system F family protein [Polycladomyces sp. WAk]|uniref:Type II secretion system F family protein n=1 Tax=Polycladomyces zharkentensis TaxID=2807616 RepID=A0ABS2WMW5_9BACL|nr:type II secretion system F family protein [Polycladomyces sp. WAk]MBN2910620.1 type II secretion system F family protein [Polycladomyces sp. WAk]